VNAVAASRKRKRLFAKNGCLSVLTGLMMALSLVGNAEAYWTATGAGSGSGPVGTLAAPTLSGSPGAGTATLNWTAVTPPGSGAVSYYVKRDGGSPGGDCPTQAAPTQVLTCTDSGLTAGTYTYTVTAVWHSWTATSSPVQVTLASGALDHFVLAAATTTPTAGQVDNLTVTAKDAAGNTVIAYTGLHCLTFSGPGSSPNGTPPSYPPQGSCASGQSALTFAAGVATAPVTLYKAETVSIIVSDGSGHSNGAGLSVTVSPAALDSFTIPTPATQTAGIAFSVSITGKDAYGNTATGYTGSQCLIFSGPGASPNGTPPTYPPRGACAAGQSAVTFTNGVAAAVPITLYNPSTSTVLTATDAPSGKNGSTGPFTVNIGPVASFTIPTPATQTAGVPFSISITAQDGYGSTVTSYTGLHCLTFSGPGASPNGTAPTYPARGSCAAGQSAVTFTNGVAAAVPITLYNASALTTLAATDGTLNGSTGAFTVNANTIASLRLAAATTTPTAGAPDNLTITALDQYGNTATSYTGSHSLIFSGATAVPNSPFTPNVTDASGTRVNFGTATAITFTNGVATVSGSANGVMRLYRGGTFSIVVSDGTYTNGSGLSVTVTVAATRISGGESHTCALLSYGGIECWGRNNYGQLGNGSTADSLIPVAVSNITNATAISAGQYHTCALLSDGTVDCWGYNNRGQLGDATTTTRTSPVAVHAIGGAGTLTGVASGGVGANHSCAVLSAGGADCWGYNNFGQLGDTTTTQRTSPVAVSLQ
jgi:hypothetical protein